jgi:hypothetical protein
MLNKAKLLFVICICLGLSMVAQAQQAMMSPPKVLFITREVVKPGKGAAHEKWEAGWPRAFAKANWPTHYIAASALTGEPRAIFLVGYDSMAAWEQDNAAVEKNTALSAEMMALADKDGDFLKELTNGVFTYMPELSYNPDMSIAGARYFGIFIVNVKPGHGDHFVEARKIAKEAHEKAKLGDHYAVYHATAGISSGRYLVFLPMKSLTELDQFPILHGKAYKDAMGEENQKKMMDFEAQGEESAEMQIFAFSPKMSYPAKDWVDADPAFWSPKPEAAKPAEKQEPKKK